MWIAECGSVSSGVSDSEDGMVVPLRGETASHDGLTRMLRKG